VLLAVLLAWLSGVLSDWIGTALLGFEKSPVSSVMVAVVLGMIAGNIVPLPRMFKPGLDFTVKKLLRLGIVFLGIRLSLPEVLKVGLLGLPIVVVCIVCAILLTTVLNRLMKLPPRLGTLIGVGTSICGVSAIVATAPVIEAEEEEVVYAITIITVFGIFATIAYPYLANLIFAGNPVKAGFFLGTAVHDTSQVTGSAMVYAQVFSQPSTLDIATVIKLVRNLFLTAVIPLASLYHSVRQAREKRAGMRVFGTRGIFPLFVGGFLLFAAMRSVGDSTLQATGRAFAVFDSAVWTAIHGAVKTWALRFLVISLAGLGLSTRFAGMKQLGVKPLLVGLSAAVTVGAISVVCIKLFAAEV